MNTPLIVLICGLLALAAAGPDMTPQQRAQYDAIKAQYTARLSPAGQQAQRMMDQLDQQIDTYYQSLPQSTRSEMDANHQQMMMAVRNALGGSGFRK